jgi:hypothetical protein
MTKAVKLKPKRVRVRVRHNGSPMVPPGAAIMVYWIEKGTGKVAHSGYVHKILHLCDEVIFIGGGWHPLKDCYLTAEQALNGNYGSRPTRSG